MTQNLILALLLAALSGPALAHPAAYLGQHLVGQYQAGPMTVPGSCVVDAPTTAKSIAELCGYNASTAAARAAGQANFLVVNPSTTQIVCIGGASISTAVTGHDAGTPAQNKCFPICDPSAGTECVAKALPVRGDIHSWYLRSTVAQKVYILFGSTP